MINELETRQENDTDCYQFSVVENDNEALNTGTNIEIAMKKFIALCGLASALTLAASSAMAGGVNWSVNVGMGGYYPPPPVYYSPPPQYNNYSNYYAPPVIYGSQVPVYRSPPQVVYTPAPLVVYGGYRGGYYQRPRYDHDHHHHHYNHHNQHHGHYRGHQDHRDYHR